MEYGTPCKYSLNSHTLKENNNLHIKHLHQWVQRKGHPPFGTLEGCFLG